MRLLSSRESAFIGVFARLGGLQKSHAFLVRRSCPTAHLSAYLSSLNGLAMVLGA